MEESKFNEIIEKLIEINNKEGFVTLSDITNLVGEDDAIDDIIDVLEKKDIYIAKKEFDSTSVDDDIDDIEIESLDDEDIDLSDLNEDIKTLSTSFKTDDPVRMYLKEIGDIPLLGPEEESIVAQRILDGQKAQAEKDSLDLNDPNNAYRIEELDALIFEGQMAKETLINANLRLVVSIAKKHVNKGLQFLDLIQEGNIGLMKAVDKFDCSKGFKFSTYATWWIRQAITRAIADQGRIVRIPVHMVEQINKVVRVQRKITQEKKQEPTLAELSKELGISEEKIKIIKKISQDPVSLESPVGEEEDSTLGDFIPDTSSLNPDEYTNKEMLKQELDRVLATLTEREERVLRRRYGLDDGRTHTLEEVGAEFGVTRERIRQIEFKAIRKIKQPTKSKKLLEYLNE